MKIISKQELESEMVSVSGKKIFTNSLKYSEEFGFAHSETLKKIRIFTRDQPRVKDEYKESIFINERNREYPFFEMTKRGYLTLVMQMGNASNKESAGRIFNKQQLFVDALDKFADSLYLTQTKGLK